MTILVAGASRGLGLELVRAGLDAGHTVIATERRETPALRELAGRHGDRLHTVRFDLTDEPAVKAAADEVRARTGTITHIVNNAGMLVGRGRGAADLDADEVARSFHVQAVGPALVVKHFLPMLVKDRGIQILNVSSQSGSMNEVTRPDYAYSMSKCALNMYTAMLRKELAPAGIPVACIHPGWIRTDMGGPDAPGDPRKAADDIIHLLQGTTSPPEGVWFFNIDLTPIAL